MTTVVDIAVMVTLGFILGSVLAFVTIGVIWCWVQLARELLGWWRSRKRKLKVDHRA